MKQLIDAKVIQDGQIDMGKLCSDPELYEEVVRRLTVLPFDPKDCGKYLSKDCDIIAATPSAIALAAPIALRTGKSLVWVEKVPSLNIFESREKANNAPLGTSNIKVSVQLPAAFKPVVAGKKVLLITDVIEGDTHLAEAIHCIEETGAEVVEIRCIWNKSGVQHFKQGWHSPAPKFASFHVPTLSIINEEQSK